MKRLFTYIISISIFFILGLLLANFLIMPTFVRQGEEIKVPNVCSLPLDSAVIVLKKAGLQGVVVERRPDRIIEEGRIIIQEPLPDVPVKKGRIINLTVSSGYEKITIPELYSVDYVKGRRILEKLGLLVGDVDSVFSDSVPQGKIIKTIPEFGNEVKKGDEIKIVVSKGVILKMPNLIGKKISEATQIIQLMNLVLKEVTEIEGSGEKGTIIVQSPEPERIVNSGDSVSLMIIK